MVSAIRWDRRLTFAGQQWDVKTGYGGPGPNHWTDTERAVHVDGNGRLHLTIHEAGGAWQCVDVCSALRTTYGVHRFLVDARLDALDPNAVLGLYLYQDDAHELDIEGSRWGAAHRSRNAQYVVQPSDHAGNLEQFCLALYGSYTTHIIDWRPQEVRFESRHGHYPPNRGQLIHSWSRQGPGIPHDCGRMFVHMNLWLSGHQAPSGGCDVPVVLTGYEFIPHCRT